MNAENSIDFFHTIPSKNIKYTTMSDFKAY